MVFPAINRRRFLIGIAAASGLAVAAPVWGYDPDWLTVVHQKLQVPSLDRPLRAVQISDLHLDRAGSCSPLLRDRVAAEIRRLKPNVIEHVTLQISGHTHGGQVTVLGLCPATRFLPHVKSPMLQVPELEPPARKDFLETRHGAWSDFFDRDDGSLLYVNRGLGRFKRVSFYCPPELTVWELLPYDTS